MTKNPLEMAINNPFATKTEPKRAKLSSALNVLVVMAVLYTLYLAKSLLMPFVVALLFSLLLSPFVALFKRFYIPRVVSAIFLIAMIGGPVTILAIELVEPVQKWLGQVPKLTAELNQELESLSLAIIPETTETSNPVPEKKDFSLLSWLSDDEVEAKVVVESPPPNNVISSRITQGGIELMVSVLGATPLVIAQFLTFVVILLFLLIFGPRLYENYLIIFPAKRGELQPIVLVEQLQKELSRYIVTVTIINFFLGLVSACVFWMMDVDDALLWGALISLLNFAPYVGPVMVLAVLSLAGVTQYGLELSALLPAAVYFCINLMEAQFVTPMVLGKHMLLNPLILILWLVVWGWLWGPVGVLIAVPLLVCLKIVAGQLNVFNKWVRLVETGS